MEVRVVLYLALSVHLAAVARGQKDPPPPPAGPVGSAGDRGAPVCGGSYPATGYITSPNYPRNYANNTDCTYYVTDASGARIQLVFNYFDLEANYDYLTISSGGLLVGRYTGSSLPPVLTLSSPVSLRFTTDYSVVRPGFSVTFTALPATCGGLVVGSGLVRSPGYPAAYSDNLRCVWGVVATQGKKVTLDFQSFNVENNYDWVELYDGNTLVARYTGTALPPRAVLGAAGRVVFTTDGSVTNPGFSISANSAVLPCGGLISGYTVITSPNYPNNYPVNASCTWTYRVQPSVASTRLNFTAFNLENYYDYVKIYGGQVLLNSLTGTALPPAIVSTSRTITVTFTSDRSIELSGFRLLFTPL